MRASIAPKVKKDLTARAFEASQLEDVKAHTFRRNRESKHIRTKLKNAKIPSNTPNGGLQEETHRERAKAEFAATKRSN
jgi:hypothetical protein